MDREFAVSVVVAVFNREKLLGRCVESIVNQIFDLPIEVILVDDQSTDGSWREMEFWRECYPDRVRIFRNPEKGVAHAKNLGIRESRGRYVAFVDSDDYLPYKAIGNLYAASSEGHSEMVIAPIYRISGGNKTIVGAQKSSEDSGETLNRFLQGNFFFLVGKLFRRDLFDRFGGLPILGISEDVSWVFPVASHLTDVAYAKEPAYYYEFSENSISTAEESESLARDAARATELIVCNTDARFRALAIRYATHRAVGYLAEKFPHYLSTILAPIEAIIPEMLKSSVVRRLSPDLVDRTRSAFADLHVRPKSIPNVFISDAIPSDGLPAEAPASVRNAYRRGDIQFVSEWLAVNRAVESGGVYLAQGIVPLLERFPFLDHETVLGYSGDEKVFSGKVFATLAHGRFFTRVLESYEQDIPSWSSLTLADRIRIVAVGVADAPHVSQCFHCGDLDLVAYPVETFIANPLGVGDVKQYSYDASVKPAGSEIPVVAACQVSFRRRNVIRMQQVRRLSERCDSLLRKLKAVPCKAGRGTSLDDVVSFRVEDSLGRAQREVSELKASVAYRVGMFVTWPARKVYRFFRPL